jgi:hypothetical protein
MVPALAGGDFFRSPLFRCSPTNTDITQETVPTS